MPFTFNMLLEEIGITPSQVRLLRHQTTLHDGRTPIELLRASRAMFDEYQQRQQHSYRAYFLAPFWATFVGLRDGRTMFTGLYEVGEPTRINQDAWCPFSQGTIPAGTDDRFPLTLSETLAPYIERLFVDWGGGASGKRAWRQRADLQNKQVVELHLEAGIRPFPGLMNLVEPLSKIADAPLGWVDQLSAARGVYLLSCPATGEAYVGSACGTDGFWGRWLQYIADGHGGNVAMRQRERSDYRASILQVAGSSDTEDDILAMEILWKRKLHSREAGLNRN